MPETLQDIHRDAKRLQIRYEYKIVAIYLSLNYQGATHASGSHPLSRGLLLSELRHIYLNGCSPMNILYEYQACGRNPQASLKIAILLDKLYVIDGIMNIVDSDCLPKVKFRAVCELVAKNDGILTQHRDSRLIRFISGVLNFLTLGIVSRCCSGRKTAAFWRPHGSQFVNRCWATLEKMAKASDEYEITYNSQNYFQSVTIESSVSGMNSIKSPTPPITILSNHSSHKHGLFKHVALSNEGPRTNSKIIAGERRAST